MKTKALPEGYHTVTPLIIVKGAAQLLDFMKDAFGAEGMTILELDGRFPPDADLDAAWASGLQSLGVSGGTKRFRQTP